MRQSRVMTAISYLLKVRFNAGLGTELMMESDGKNTGVNAGRYLSR